MCHLDRVLEIEALSYPTPWSRRAFQSELTENAYAYYHIVRANDTIIGYVGMWVILEESHITNIAIHPDYQNRGVGRFVLENMFQRARELGSTKMTLEVRVSNASAIHLYRSLGFQDRGIRKGYYTDTHEDAIVMWKDNLAPGKPRAEQVKWMGV